MMKKGPLALPQDDKVFIQIAFVFQVDGMEKKTGGEGGIRTHDTLRYTRFPSERTRPAMRPLRASGIITEFGINGSPKNPQRNWEILSFLPVTVLIIDCFSIENLVGL